MEGQLEELSAPMEFNGELDLKELVKNATWRDLLITLVETNKLDPWNIDIVKIVDSYIGAVKKMRVIDLHVPANIILAASILLRMKSATIAVFAQDEQPAEEEVINGQRIIPTVDALVPRFRLQPNRRITLEELVSALDGAMKIKERREITVQQPTFPDSFVIKQEDIDEKIDSTYSFLKENCDSDGLSTFAQLANKFSCVESILFDLFVPILFLANRGRVILMQEKFFDEIFIKLNDDKHV